MSEYDRLMAISARAMAAAHRADAEAVLLCPYLDEAARNVSAVSKLRVAANCEEIAAEYEGMNRD